MIKSIVWVLPALLYFTLDFSKGLECYHCYSDLKRDMNFVQCNQNNLTASNTWVCPSANAQCVYQDVEIQSTKTSQTFRTCSNGISDPCDPNSLPPGFKQLRCSSCGTDRCNLYFNEKEKNKNNNTFTFNINANINLYIRQ